MNYTNRWFYGSISVKGSQGGNRYADYDKRTKQTDW